MYTPTSRKITWHFFRHKIEKKDETIRKQNIQIEATQIPGQMSLFETNEELAKALEANEGKIVVPSHKRTPRTPGVRKEMLAGLPKEITEYMINEEDAYHKCGSPLKVIGEEIVRTEVEYKPAKLILKQIVRQIAKCTKCGTEGSEKPNQHIEKAAIPKNVLSHSI